MRFKLKSNVDAPFGYASRRFAHENGEPLKKGDEITVSGNGYEDVMRADYKALYIEEHGEGFEPFTLIEEIPEFDHERRMVEKRQMREQLETKLEKTPMPKLRKEAKKKGVPVPARAKKAEIVQAVVGTEMAKAEAQTAEEIEHQKAADETARSMREKADREAKNQK